MLAAAVNAGGNQHACVVKTDFSAACVGVNTQGQLGDKTTTNSSTPVAVVGLRGAADGVKVKQVSVADDERALI